MRKWFGLLAILMFACGAFAQSTVTQTTYPSVGSTCYVPGQKIIVQVGINVLAVFQCQGGVIVQIGGSPSPSPAGGGVVSFAGRSGVVVPIIADYSAFFDLTGAAAARAGVGACTSGLYETADATGGPTCAQPAFSQLSGQATNAQLPATLTAPTTGNAATATAAQTVPTGCPAGSWQYPCVVAKVDLTAQAAAIGQTTMFTVVTPGRYRASFYSVVTQAATSSSTLSNCYFHYLDEDTGVSSAYQDGNSQTANTIGTISNGGAGVNFNAGAGAVKYEMAIYASSGATPMQYAAHFTLEYLGP
jgi:hypothetical protein